MPKVDVAAVPEVRGTLYPPPFDELSFRRVRQRLGDAAGLTQLGVNLHRLAPGQWSSQRHWHSAEDEAVFVLEGEAVLVDEEGEHVLRAGDFAGFKAGVPDGHHLQNRSDRDVVFLEIGSRRPDLDVADYVDVDLQVRPGVKGYVHKDGAPYPVTPRRSA